MKYFKIAKPVLLLLGWFFFFLALVGIFIPLLPTTPFALLSAYFFSKCSPRLHNWLLATPLLGSVIRDWQDGGVIKLRSKILSTIVLISLMSVPLIKNQISLLSQIIILIVMCSVLVFIWSRPHLKKS